MAKKKKQKPDFSKPKPAKNLDAAVEENLEAIETYAFEGCDARIVKIPVSCRTIGDGAFQNCPNLKIVFLPANAILGEDVFAGCQENMQIIYQ